MKKMACRAGEAIVEFMLLAAVFVTSHADDEDMSCD